MEPAKFAGMLYYIPLITFRCLFLIFPFYYVNLILLRFVHCYRCSFQVNWCKDRIIFYISKSFCKFFSKEFQILENNFEIFVESSVWRYVEPIQGVCEKIGFRMKSNRNTESCEKWGGWEYYKNRQILSFWNLFWKETAISWVSWNFVYPGYFWWILSLLYI